MKLIIPMAGRGTRLRPHTHVTPKPLLPVVGTPMVERIVNTFTDVLPRKLDAAVFVLGPDFPAEVYEALRAICARHGLTPHFAVQETALGTGHAVHCAGDHLRGEVIVVFADTLFYMEPGVDLDDVDVVAWTKWVEDPRRFGVAVKDESGRITALVEKPQTLVSHDTLIGIYFVREGELLRRAIQRLIDEDIRGHGEYQLTDALDLMLQEGRVFRTAGVTDWLDAGTIPAIIETSRAIREKEADRLHHGEVQDSVIIDPVYIGPGARVEKSVVGPHVTIEAGAVVRGSVVRNSILFAEAEVEGVVLEDSVVGHHARVDGRPARLNIGDHSSAG